MIINGRESVESCVCLVYGKILEIARDTEKNYRNLQIASVPAEIRKWNPSEL